MTSQPELEKFLGSARFAPYLTEAHGNIDRAQELYRWNNELSGAVHAQLSHVEILTRNAIDAALANWCGSLNPGHDWTAHQQTPTLLYDLGGDAIRRARRDAKREAAKRPHTHPRHGAVANHDDIVAQLTFGFWPRILGATDPSLTPKAKTLWTDALCQAFPNAYTSDKGREYVGKRLERLRQLRNRVSHHENLLRVNLNDRMKDVATALNAIDPNCASWAFQGSRVRSVARADPRNFW